MIFNGERTAFGRHETFSLRYSWLPKGYQALQKNNSIFTAEDATLILGVGKNMVSSIRYWLRACQIIDAETLLPTPIGELIFSSLYGLDPYLEDEATLWLLHWLLATNPEQATACYWFFNRYHKPEFSNTELLTALSDFVAEEVVKAKRPANSTMKNDVQLVLRMYSQTKANARIPLEESLDSPLSELRLITQSSGGQRYLSRPDHRPSLPIEVLGFAVLQLLQTKQVKALPIEDLMYVRDSFCAPGAVFRLTESALITKLEQLVESYPKQFAIRDTAGIHQFFVLQTLDPLELLKAHYKGNGGVAA